MPEFSRARDPAAVDDSGAPLGPGLPLHALLVVAALAAGAADQGAYYRGGQWPLALLLLAALVTALRARPWSEQDSGFLPLWPVVALAVWVLVRATFAGDFSAGLPAVALMAAFLAVVVVVRRVDDLGALAAAAVAVGCLVALSGWAGVVWRISPWAGVNDGLWRAATSLTYANAAGALLALLAALALAGLVARPGSRRASMSASVLLLGVAATLSRGGLLAAAIGIGVLAALLGARAVARVALAPVVGAAIAFAGLIPSVPAGSPPRPLLAVVALTAGLAAAAGLPSLSNLGPRVVRLGIVAVGTLVATVMVTQGAGPVRALGDSRFTVSSPDRAHALRSSLELVASHPIAGVGPGRAVLSWTGPDGRSFVAKYVHNEYVQVLLELGILGVGLLLAILGATAGELRRAAGGPRRDLWAGGAAGLAALSVGSAFDFLWHVPVIPLFGALLVGVAVPPARKEHQ